mgnify:CR=1 FL=1
MHRHRCAGLAQVRIRPDASQSTFSRRRPHRTRRLRSTSRVAEKYIPHSCGAVRSGGLRTASLPLRRDSVCVSRPPSAREKPKERVGYFLCINTCTVARAPHQISIHPDTHQSTMLIHTCCTHAALMAASQYVPPARPACPPTRRTSYVRRALHSLPRAH